MRKALMIVSLTAFAAAAAFAAPRNSDVPATTNDEVAALPIDDQASDSAKTVDDKDCGCNKGKKGRK
jgi:hypothetical protein